MSTSTEWRELASRYATWPVIVAVLVIGAALAYLVRELRAARREASKAWAAVDQVRASAVKQEQQQVVTGERRHHQQPPLISDDEEPIRPVPTMAPSPKVLKPALKKRPAPLPVYEDDDTEDEFDSMTEYSDSELDEEDEPPSNLRRRRVEGSGTPPPPPLPPPATTTAPPTPAQRRRVIMDSDDDE